jgi:hypothetical protein
VGIVTVADPEHITIDVGSGVSSPRSGSREPAGNTRVAARPGADDGSMNSAIVVRPLTVTNLLHAFMTAGLNAA